MLARKFEILSQLDYTQSDPEAAMSAAEDILREFMARGSTTDTADSADRWLRKG